MTGICGWKHTPNRQTLFSACSFWLFTHLVQSAFSVSSLLLFIHPCPTRGVVVCKREELLHYDSNANACERCEWQIQRRGGIHFNSIPAIIRYSCWCDHVVALTFSTIEVLNVLVASHITYTILFSENKCNFLWDFLQKKQTFWNGSLEFWFHLRLLAQRLHCRCIHRRSLLQQRTSKRCCWSRCLVQL